MSFCPPPSRILCLSLLTSSSSSFRGGSFAFTGLRGKKIKKKKKNQPFSYFLSPRPSFYISAIKSTLQHCQYCWTGDAHIGRISLIIRFAFKSTQPPLSVSLCSIRCDPQPGAQWVLQESSPGPDEESVLDQHSDEEEHHSFHSHGKEISSH